MTISRVCTIGLSLVAACGPGTAAMTDGPATGTATTDSATGDVPTSTAIPTSTAADTTMATMPGSSSASSGPPDPTLPSTTTASTEATTDATDPVSGTASTGTANTGTASTGTEACSEDTVVCIDDALQVCDGNGGFKDPPDGNQCAFGCADASECTTCAQGLADKDCPAGLPRVMLLLDASSAMLALPAPTPWDQVRDSLAGAPSMFDVILDNNEIVAHQALIGLTVFGDDGAGSKQVVQYGACHKENLAWALDPASSCEAPGCVDPHGLPPIKWTFKDGSMHEPPGFAETTISHMPKCDFSAQKPMQCIGSKRFLHLGLDLAQDNLAAYKIGCKQSKPACTAQTQFFNIVIIVGKYDSTDAQVQPPLQAMFTAGVTTHVIGFGGAIDPAQLEKLADWGSGNQLNARQAADQDQLEMHLAQILDTLDLC